MEKIIKQCILYDFYGPLLTEHQREVYEMNVYDNMSLQEIAEEIGVSRQAVHDIIKRCDILLQDYDSRLGLIGRFEECKGRLESIKTDIENMDFNGCDKSEQLINRINAVIDKL